MHTEKVSPCHDVDVDCGLLKNTVSVTKKYLKEWSESAVVQWTWRTSLLRQMVTGANHRDNFIPMPHNINQALGRHRDDIMYAYVGAERTRKAVLVSRRSTETVDNAEQLRLKAKKDLKELLKKYRLDKIIAVPQSAVTVVPNVGVARGDEDMVEKCLEKAREDPQYFLEIIKAWKKFARGSH